MKNMDLDMNEIETQHFGVLRRAIDTELKDLSIWTIPRPPKLIFFNNFLKNPGFSRSWNPKISYVPVCSRIIGVGGMGAAPRN